jgi:hypothetical protein
MSRDEAQRKNQAQRKKKQRDNQQMQRPPRGNEVRESKDRVKIEKTRKEPVDSFGEW